MEQKKQTTAATPDEPTQAMGAWGEANNLPPTKEQVDEMKRMQLMKYCQYQLKTDKSLNSFQRKGLVDRMKLARKHQFWDEQPVHHFTSDEVAIKDGPIKQGKVADVSKEPTGLPAGFEWVNLDLADEE